MDIQILENSKDSARRRVSLQLVITGQSTDKERGIVCIQPPKYAAPFDYTEICVKELAEGETLVLDLAYELVHGGRYVFYAWEKGNQLPSLCKAVVNMGGAGIYSGNTHSHSTYSDGKSTLQENRAAMMNCGHSFIYATDHNTTAHNDELREYEKMGVAENFLHIPGWEFTTKYGHAIAYGSMQTYDTDRIPERNNLQAWQEFVDTMNEEGARVFFAHPYEAPRYEFGDDVLKNITGVVGIEAWNGYNYHALAYQNRKNFEVWDLFNCRGDGHYAGNAVSDAHTGSGQSSPYIKGYLKELSKKAVEEMLVQGRFIGSNGPEIDFSIGEAGIGETYQVEKDASGKMQKALVRLDVFDPLGDIEAINVYKAVIDGVYGLKPNTRKVLEFYPMGENEKRNFAKNIYGCNPR